MSTQVETQTSFFTSSSPFLFKYFKEECLHFADSYFFSKKLQKK